MLFVSKRTRYSNSRKKEKERKVHIPPVCWTLGALAHYPVLTPLAPSQVQNVMRGNSKMEEALQRITGHTVAKIHEDFQRDFYLSSAEAVQYGIIDEVLLPREKTRQDMYKERGVRGTVSLASVGCGAHPFWWLLLVVRFVGVGCCW